MNGVFTSAAGARAVRDRYRELLAGWPVPAEHRTVPTREGDTFVVACGPPGAPPVVLLHGAGSNALTWAGDAAVWSGHRRVYAVDVIGEPGLSAPSRPPLDSDAHALWLDDVLDGLGVRRAAFVGVSFGGWIALDYAIRRTDRVERLALLCPAGLGRQRWSAVLAAQALMPFGEWGRGRAMRLVLGGGPPVTPHEQAIMDFLGLVNRHLRPRRDRIPVIGDAELERLARSAMPLLVIVGDRDRLLDSHGTRRRVERAVPHAVVRRLPDAGHLLRDQTGPVLEFLTAGEGVRNA
ncbi:alpha/beta fold hydrolase [Thermomonospora cellulosilytica]|uniref:Pimeloyl-ACP methyl ester carboxylesterase n=1 Tax=Thermomonospora cellulosilytica TaxID=1411118 RepID=A0A7W3R851_9ACTN|nr:alpha/beta fold hydrolase [Thermomonospora cellulosilytica]MBA9003928.1 pimeloyl-ACP methyl ester carboxylesterase [Thermomonospora cellulosilytica]